MNKFLFLLGIGFILTFVSCSKEEDPIDQFVGNWSAEDKLTVGNTTTTETYNFTVARGDTDAELKFTSFAQVSGATITAQRTNRNFTLPDTNITITLDSTTVNGTFSGSGTVDGNRMTYTYSFSAPGFSQVWNGTARK